MLQPAYLVLPNIGFTRRREELYLVERPEKGIQEFTLNNMDETPLELHAYLFSYLNFQGFPCLLSLHLSEVEFGSYKYGKFLASCPDLEILKLRSNIDGEIKRDEIEKLENLKVLILPLYELSLMDDKKRVRTTLVCLKKLRLYEVYFSNAIMVSCVIDLISGFPNLETLLIKATFGDDVPAPTGSSLEVDFSRMTELQLQKVKFVSVRCIKNEMCLKSLMACSPLLEKMVINPKSSNS
ncbi:F-box/FBD/LRR-repeat protein-like protein [Tanacetum coccineum]